MYVKVFSTMARSSVWRNETPETRCVWLALLWSANRDGFVKGIESWLAVEANVTLEACREALERLSGPDLESQSQEYGGRRIERIEGGWLVLNHKKYREMRTEAQVREAERKARQRAKPKPDMEIADDAPTADDDVPGHVPHVPTIASASAGAVVASSFARASELEPEAPPPPPPPAPRVPDSEADRFEHPDHRAAYLGLRARHAFPASLDAGLREIHAPSTGGAGYPWAVIGAALVQALANGAPFNVSLVRGYCRTHVAGAAAPPVSRTNGNLLAAGASARVGAQLFTASQLWVLCTDAGLAAPMQSRETLDGRIRELHAAGKVEDTALFTALVLHVRPWELAEVKFLRERDERLRGRLMTWQPQVQAEAS